MTVLTRAFKVVHDRRPGQSFSKEVAYLSALADRIKGGKPSGWTRLYAGLWKRSKSCVHQWVRRYREDADIICFEDQLRRTDAWLERHARRIPSSVFEEKVDGVVAELAGWMLRTMDQNSQRRRWRGVLAGLVKEIWTVTKHLFLLTTEALSEEKREYPEKRRFEITLKGVQAIDAKIARWVRSPELVHARPRYRLVRMLHGEPLYALTDAGRKAYYAARAHSQATRRGERKRQPEHRKTPPPTAPEGSLFTALTSEMARVMTEAMGRSVREDGATHKTTEPDTLRSQRKEALRHRRRSAGEQLRPPHAISDRSLKVMTRSEARAAVEYLPHVLEMVAVDGGYIVQHK